MVTKYLAAILFLSSYSQFSQAEINLEATSSTIEHEKVQALTAEIFQNPIQMAGEWTSQLSALPEYG